MRTSALPIEAGQTISQPYIVARMIELLELRPSDTVLEVGAGSGYAAAVLSRIASKVFAIERHDVLANQARERIARLGYANAKIIFADGTKGLPEQAPFDAILVSAGGPKVPETLKQQLAIGGRLVIPVGRGTHQTLYRVRRVGDDEFEEEDSRRRHLRAADRRRRLGRAGRGQDARRQSTPKARASPLGC